MIASVRSKNLFRFLPHALAVGDDVKRGFDIGKKGTGGLIIAPVPKQRHRLADDGSCGAKRRADRGGLRSEGVRSRMVTIPGIKAGIEE